MPVRNAERTLPNTLKSLEWQTDRDWEAVIVDDGSTDATPHLLKTWNDPRKRVITQPPEGLVAALNRGLQHCRGDLVARLDADDLAHPHRLALQRQAMGKADVVGSKVRLFPNLKIGFRRYERWLNSLLTHEEMRRDLYIESPLVHPSVMIRKEWLQDGYRDLDGPEDYDLWLRLFHQGARFAKVDRVLLFWRDSPERLTRRHPSYRKSAILRLKVEHLRDPRSLVVWGAGDEGKRLARELLAQGRTVEAFADLHPGRIGQRIDGIPVFSPRQPFPPETLQGRLHLAAVGRDGGRAEVRAELEQWGLKEGSDYVCFA